MQPGMNTGVNNNMGTVNNATRPVQPVAAPAAPQDASQDVVFQDKPKKNSYLILGMILFAVLAAGGIGFGVWAMMDGNAQTAKLNEQIDALEQQNDSLQQQNEELTEKLGQMTNPVDGSYLDIAEWGYRVKMPEGLGMVSYQYQDDGDEESSINVIGLAGTSASDEELPEFADFSTNTEGLMKIRRLAVENAESCGENLLFSDDSFAYCAELVEAEKDSSKYSEGEDGSLFLSSLELVHNMMKNKENYTAL